MQKNGLNNFSMLELQLSHRWSEINTQLGFLILLLSRTGKLSDFQCHVSMSKTHMTKNKSKQKIN